MHLISITIFNSMVEQNRRWQPFRNGANGLACSACGQELRDTPGETIFIREDQTRFRNVECGNERCTFKGKREIL